MRARLALVAILVLAACLRFTGLGWGLRHTPDRDERVFVENTARMLGHRDLDHRFYEYPGLVFYLLALPLVIAGNGYPPAPTAYVVARALIAGFGVLSVGLVYLLGRRLASPRAGLLAALLLAVSPLEVDVAHMVRPDVVLESCVLLALLSFPAAGSSTRGALASGAALGLATSVKFSGVLLAPSWLLAWLASPDRRFSHPVIAALASLAVFFCLTPYALLHAQPFFAQAMSQLTYHYPDVARGSVTYAEMLRAYAWVLAVAVGPGALGLLAAPALLRDWRRWLPLAVFPLVCLGVFASSPIKHDRFLLPCVGVLALLIAATLDHIHPQPLFAGLAAIAAIFPLAASLLYVRNITRPSTWDRAVDWSDAQLPPGARVLCGVPDLGLDPGRFEVLAPTGSDLDDPLLEHAVSLIIQDMPAADGRTPLFMALPGGPGAGPPIWLFAPRSRSFRGVPLDHARFSASDAAADLPALHDANPATLWGPATPQPAWLQVDFPEPVLLGRIELSLGTRPARRAGSLQLLASADGVAWAPLRAANGRAPVERQPPTGPPSQVLLVEPVRVRGVRIVDAGTGPKRWGVAEIAIEEVVQTP